LRSVDDCLLSPEAYTQEQRVQHLILYFEHGIEDIIPWCTLIEKLQPQLAQTGAGEFESDDMAIDGGDCEAIFRGTDVRELFAALLPHFQSLSFLRKPTTTVELVFGEIDSSSERQAFGLES
jgi:hypothetical protein